MTDEDLDFASEEESDGGLEKFEEEEHRDE